MGLTLTTADAVLKEDYQGALRDQLNQQNMLLSQVEKNTDDIVGRRAVIALHVGRSSGVGARLEGGVLPTADAQKYTDEYVNLRYNYGRIEVSGPTIKAMASDRGSFVRAVKSETEGITNDLKKDVNRQLYGTSDGVIATCGVTTASATIVLAASTTAVQMRQFEVDELIDVGTVAQLGAGSGGRIYGAKIVSVDVTNKTITINSAITTAATDFVARAGNGGSGANQKELTGLQNIVAATGTLFGVNPTTYPTWASTVDANGGTPRSISETLVAKALHNGRIASGSEVDMLVSSDGVHRAYANLLTSLKRFTNTMELKGGFLGLEVAAGGKPVPLVWDRDCPTGTLFGLSTSRLTEYYSSDWEWMDDDGAVLSRVPNKDAYEAVLYKYHELATDRRNAHVKIVDLIEA